MKLSFSQIDTYNVCPLKYKYRYKDKLPEHLSKALSFGISIHASLYKFLSRIHTKKPQQDLFAETEKIPTLEDLHNDLDNSWNSVGYESKKDMYEKKVYGMKVLDSWYNSFLKSSSNILALENSFLLEIDDEISISGRFDRIDTISEDTIEIIDYKTGKLKTQAEADKNLQLSLYYLAAKSLYPSKKIILSLYFLEHETKIMTQRTTHDTEITKNLVTKTAEQIENQFFDPTPSEWNCSYCSYNKICPSAFTSSQNENGIPNKTN